MKAQFTDNFHRLDQEGQITFSLKKLYIEGLEPPTTHVHWRRFATKDIPLNDPAEFDQWLYRRWVEKDALLKHFQAHDQFPTVDGYSTTGLDIRTARDFLWILTGVPAVLAAWWLTKIVARILAYLLTSK